MWLNPTVDILHVDSAIIVLNKPAGLPVLPDGWEQDAPYVVRHTGGPIRGRFRGFRTKHLDRPPAG